MQVGCCKDEILQMLFVGVHIYVVRTYYVVHLNI